MKLLACPRGIGHIAEAIFHFNHASDLNNRSQSRVDSTRSMFDGLNKLQTEWLMNQVEQQIGEVKAFQTMILDGLRTEDRVVFLRSSELQNFVSLEPKIMNHDILRHGGYRPDVPIGASLAKKAAEVHRKAESAYRDFEHEGDNAVEERLIKRIAELLYIVRSNIAHGEKTPYGPDLAKKKRDEQVCTSLVPVMEVLIDSLLEYPSKKLIAYGTLAPGKSNHQMVADLPGQWEECTIRGSIELDQGLSTFSWNPTGSELRASLLTSDLLPKGWQRLDTFEGSRYKRHLIPGQTQTGVTVAYAYVANSVDA